MVYRSLQIHFFIPSIYFINTGSTWNFLTLINDPFSYTHNLGEFYNTPDNPSNNWEFGVKLDLDEIYECKALKLTVKLSDQISSNKNISIPGIVDLPL